MIKKILTGLAVILGVAFCIYFFYIRERYINKLHTKLNIGDFTEDVEGLEKMVQWYYETYHIPSISAAIIEDGRVVKYISKGQLSKKNDTKVDENSIYQIASTSKTFTGIICKSLVLEGILDLDKTITDYLIDDLPSSSHQKYKNISLRQVLHHTSGLGRSMPAYEKRDIIASLVETPLEFQPGTKHQYSNFGYALITLIMETASGKTYGQLVKEYVSEPFNLPDIYAERDQVPANKLVTPYFKHFRLMEGKTSDFGLQIGGSGLFTNCKTLADLTIQQMQDYQRFDSLKDVSTLILTNDKAHMYKDHHYGFGLFEFNYKIDGIEDVIHKNLEHGGDADGFACIYDYFPKYQCGIVVLTSSGGNWLNEMTWNMNSILAKRNYANYINLDKPK